MRLRTLLALAFAFVALAVSLCCALTAQVLTSARMEQRTGAEMANLAGQVRNLFDHTMYSRWRDIKILATVAETAGPTADDRRAWLDAMRKTFPAYAWIGFADLNGTVTAATDRTLEGASVAGRAWFGAGLNGSFVGDLHQAILLAKQLPVSPDGAPWRLIDLSAPVYDANHRLTGVVGAHLGWSWARTLAHSVLDPVLAHNPTTDILVVDQGGTIIIGPPELQDTRLPDRPTLWHGGLGTDADAADASMAEGFALETWPDGHQYLVGASRTTGMEDYPGLGWTVLVRQSAETAFASAHRLARELLMAGALLAATAAVLGWFTAWRIGRPLLMLADAADGLSRSPGLRPLPEAKGTEEVRRLSLALRHMLDVIASRDREVAETNQNLECRVAERTHQLETARRAAEAGSRAKSRFLAGVSHELRTPLNGILGYAQLLQLEGGLNERQASRLDAMLGAGHHLLEMINRVLDISAVEAERVELRPMPLDLAELARTCLDYVRPAADAKGLALLFTEPPRGLPSPLADPTRVRQMLLNLLGNAVKFTASGRVELRLSMAACGTAIRIDVADTGPGIPAERRHRLFRDYDRLDAHAAEGSGLGLALSARLAAAMGGKIGCENRPEGGSIFWLELPVVSNAPAILPLLPAEPAVPAEASPEPVGSARSHDADGRHLSILVVDDMAMNRDIAASMLRSAGHDVACAATGLEAVTAAASDDYDVVLMDVRMPGMDGLEATGHIRALAGARGRVPIVALTAQAFSEQITECRAAGMDLHIPKPFTRDDLLRAVTRAAGMRQPAEALAAEITG